MHVMSWAGKTKFWKKMSVSHKWQKLPTFWICQQLNVSYRINTLFPDNRLHLKYAASCCDKSKAFWPKISICMILISRMCLSCSIWHEHYKCTALPDLHWVHLIVWFCHLLSAISAISVWAVYLLNFALPVLYIRCEFSIREHWGIRCVSGSQITDAPTYNCFYSCLLESERFTSHYSDVITSAMTSQITRASNFYSTICSGADQRNHQNPASLAFVGVGIHLWPVNSPHKGPVTRKMFPFDDVIMFQ